MSVATSGRSGGRKRGASPKRAGGLKRAPAVPPAERLDAVIIGAGVAGLSAALWLRDFGLDVVVVEEGARPGGQLHEIHAAIPNYLAAYGWDGARLAGAVMSDARAAALPLLVGAGVRRISARGLWVERGADDAGGPARLHARSLVVATGLRRRVLGVPGESDFVGRGVSHSANRDRMRFEAKPVVVVGGGTAAIEDAMLCADAGSDVTLLHHTNRFRARRDFLDQARANPRIRIVERAAVVRIMGSETVTGVEYRVRGSRRVERADAAGVFIRIGWEPRSELVRRHVRCDAAGYVRTTSAGATSAPWVFAAGDVCSPRCPAIANAVGGGAAVAWEIGRRLGRVRG
jgi:thioredoxin reductase (NADPH)